LSDVARRRIAAVLLIGVIVIAVLALTDTGPFDDPPTEEQLVEATAVLFYDAAAAGDFDAYCALLTSRARDQIQANAARLAAAAGGDLGKCPDVVALAADAFKGGALKIRQVSVSGNRARVEANYRVEGKPGVQAKTIYLELNPQGEWRVSDPG
jgi:hypothetical protein